MNDYAAYVLNLPDMQKGLLASEHCDMLLIDHRADVMVYRFPDNSCVLKKISSGTWHKAQPIEAVDKEGDQINFDQRVPTLQ